jgi:asparagine synthase (glutamine-hydrolysing)
MCGICGIAGTDPVDSSILESMAEALRHRGPDSDGFYLSPPTEGISVGLGFRRLSIIDLVTGDQPLANEDGTIWIVFNGEIYNFRELRHGLESRGHRFRTHSDTEAIVHLYEEHGPRCVEQLSGMFALGIWDERLRQLTLARDRFGKKPLYYAPTQRGLIFA